MRLLFVKQSLEWPRVSGHDVHTYEMMRALAGLGHEVSLVTVRDGGENALAGLPLSASWCLECGNPPSAGRVPRLTRLQERFRSYWGVEPSHISAVGAIAQLTNSDAVIAVGLEALPFLCAVDHAVRVWYAADEWVWHHLSLMKWNDRGSWRHLRAAIVKGAYERVYRSEVDRVWVVTETERRAMAWFAGLHTADVLPNGVDTEHFRPVEGAEIARSAVFWGRLDFEPNVQALSWFCRRVWPLVRAKAPDAKLTIVGFHPGAAVRDLASCGGVSIAADLPDLRHEASRHQLVILPFVSGGGIKNKLLEAASLAKPIVCTPRACNGLRGLVGTELVRASRPEEWSREMLALWNHEDRRRGLGTAARAWVLAHHAWPAVAREAAAALEQAIGQRKHARRDAAHAA